MDLPAVSDFNGMVCSAIDQAISDVLSVRVMEALYAHLQRNYVLTRDEIPYRLDTFFSALENVFGAKNSRTIGRAAARILYAHLNMNFEYKPSFALSDYVNEAKTKLETDDP